MLTDKKLKKISKELGKDAIEALDKLPESELRYQVVQSGASIKAAEDALQSNKKYQEMKECIKDLSDSMKDVRKRQNAIIEYSLHLLEEKGKA